MHHRRGEHRGPAGAGASGPGWTRGGDGRRAASPAAEHGRGLKIIDAVADNLQLTGNARNGTTITHFEKTLDYLPGAAGSLLISAERR